MSMTFVSVPFAFLKEWLKFLYINFYFVRKKIFQEIKSTGKTKVKQTLTTLKDVTSVVVSLLPHLSPIKALSPSDKLLFLNYSLMNFY